MGRSNIQFEPNESQSIAANAHEQRRQRVEKEILEALEKAAIQNRGLTVKELCFQLSQDSQNLVRIAIVSLLTDDKVCFDSHLRLALSPNYIHV